jgi:hypothetical protein
MLFVRMLTIILQRMSRSIQTKEACSPVITAASSVTSDPYVLISRLRMEGSNGASSKSYIKHSTFDSTSGSTASAAVCSFQPKWQIKEEQIKALQEKDAH